MQTAIDAFGRVDIVVNNAGILRDKAFHNLTPEFLEPGARRPPPRRHPRDPTGMGHMREQGYGRVISTSSSAGLFGNFGQANYGAAKMGLVGLTNVLAVEGARYNVKANAIAPLARTRMTEEVLGPVVEYVDPALVSPVVAWLAHEDCPVSGHIYSVAGGQVARLFVGMAPGYVQTDRPLTVEDVRDHFDEIEDPTGFTIPKDANDELRALRRALEDSRS